MKNKQYDFDNPYEAYQTLGMDMVWMMRNFDEIKLKDMEDSHIYSCIRMLKKNISKKSFGGEKTYSEYWVDVFEDVVFKRRLQKIKTFKNNINENR